MVAYFKVDINHHLPGRNDVRHDEYTSNTHPLVRDPQPGPHKNTTKRILVNDQTDAKFFFLLRLFQSYAYFEQPRAHHQENQLYQYNVWYMSLCVGGRLVCRSLTYTEWHIPEVVLIQLILLMMSTRLLETRRGLMLPRCTVNRTHNKHRDWERRVSAKGFKHVNWNYAMNIQFRSYHWKHYTEFDPKSVLYGYTKFSLDNEQCVSCLSAICIQYDCETFN
jgi:hypothetical protein